MKVETQRSLADQGCDNPDCDNPECRNPPQLFFHGCHGHAFEVMYEKETGYLVLICGECQSPVMVFQVAAGGH